MRSFPFSIFSALNLISIVPFILMTCETNGYPMATKTRSNVQNYRQRRAITRFHDTLAYQPNNSNRSFHTIDRVQRWGSSAIPKYKLLPADESLREKYYSKKVEDELGNAKIGRIRRNDQYTGIYSNGQVPYYNEVQAGHLPAIQAFRPFPTGPSLSGVPPTLTQQQTPYSPVQPQPLTAMDKKRVDDLEEIFKILVRRDGSLLEQMLSLRDAIDRFYGIFEFMGVAKMPALQRDAAVKKILERALNIDTENAAKRARLYV